MRIRGLKIAKLCVVDWCTSLQAISTYVMQHAEDLLKPETERSFLRCQLQQGNVVVVLATPYMIKQALEHGHAGPISMDATHGMLMYGFKLVTLLAVNHQGRGVPIAWAIIQHETIEVYAMIIGDVKRRCELVSKTHWDPSAWLVDASDAEIGGIRCESS